MTDHNCRWILYYFWNK